MAEKRTDPEAPEPQLGHPKEASLGTLLNNPLVGMTREQVVADVEGFIQERGLTEHREDFVKGALVAQVTNQDYAFEQIKELREDEKNLLRREITHRWSQPFMLYFLCTLCAGSAIVQGMDQSAVNAAQVSLLKFVIIIYLIPGVVSLRHIRRPEKLRDC